MTFNISAAEEGGSRMGSVLNVKMWYVITILDRLLSNVHLSLRVVAVMFFVVFVILACLAALCNMFIFFIIIRDRALRARANNLLILASCITDALGAMVVPAAYFAYVVLYLNLPGVTIAYQEAIKMRMATNWLIIFSTSSNNLILLLIVISRYRGIMYPLTRRPYSYKRTLVMIICAFCISVTNGAINFMIQQYRVEISGIYFLHFAIILGIPMMIMAVLVFKMYRELTSTRRQGLLPTVVGRQRKRSQKMTLYLYISYVVTSTPFLLIKLVLLVISKSQLVPNELLLHMISVLLILFSDLLISLNGFINLIIYTLMCKDIKDAVCKTFGFLHQLKTPKIKEKYVRDVEM